MKILFESVGLVLNPVSALASIIAVVLVVAAPVTLSAQVGGNLAEYPPVELDIEVTSTPEGPVLSDTEFELVTGEYYRMSITTDGEEDWRFEAPDLLQNSHLRLVTVNQIEVHLQGMSFRAIEIDEGGTARFSFTPIRPGSYEFFVGDVPSLVGRPIGAPGLSDDARAVVGRFLVR
ncbi:MAG: hypothetical protein ACOC8K_01190 [Gemmatimonadota bacterium]